MFSLLVLLSILYNIIITYIACIFLFFILTKAFWISYLSMVSKVVIFISLQEMIPSHFGKQSLLFNHVRPKVPTSNILWAKDNTYRVKLNVLTRQSLLYITQSLVKQRTTMFEAFNKVFLTSRWATHSSHPLIKSANIN